MAGWYAEFQAQRLAQLRAMRPEDLSALIEQMATSQPLPSPDYHFRRHHREFQRLGVHDQVDYLALFDRHIQRSDLVRFTYLDRRGRRMWAHLAPDNHAVALYDETEGRYYSFLRPRDIYGYLASGTGWWVDIERTVRGWRIRPW